MSTDEQMVRFKKNVLLDSVRTLATVFVYIYNHLHNILRVFDVLPIFTFTTRKTMCDYHL